MKKFTIATFLRPAIPVDVFDKDGLGTIFNNKQFFFKLNNGCYFGPKRIVALPTELKHSYRKDDPIFLSKKASLARKSNFQYLEIYRWMYEAKLYIVDPVRYLESIPIHLKVKQVAAADYIKENKVIVNTAYFKLNENKMNGPFFITHKHSIQTFTTSILEAKMFVFDKPGQEKRIENQTTAEAV